MGMTMVLTRKGPEKLCGYQLHCPLLHLHFLTHQLSSLTAMRFYCGYCLSGEPEIVYGDLRA